MITTREEFIKKLYESPQKYEEYSTISYQMKLGIFDFFKDKQFKCLEIGCYKGYTTNIISNIFTEVIGLDNNEENLKYAKINNSQNKNVSFIQIDLYNRDEWKSKIECEYKDKFEVALVDAGHSYENCKSDLMNAINLGCKYIIIDDVGVYEGIKRAVSEIQTEYNSKINSVIGIDWKHYKLPLLNIPIYCLRIQEKNMGMSQFEFTWVLKDKTDIDINNGNENKPMYNPMNINLHVIRNYAEFLGTGHDFNRIKRENPKQIVSLMYDNNSMRIVSPDVDKPNHTFTPFPIHRFSQKEIQSFMSENEEFDKTDNNFEGLILENL